AVAGLPKARRPVDAPSDRDPELLSREGSLRQSGSDQRQHPRDAQAGSRVSRSRVPAPQSPQGHRDAPSSSHRMNTGAGTVSGEERTLLTYPLASYNFRMRAICDVSDIRTFLSKCPLI